MPQMNGKFLFDTIMECIDNNIGEGEIKESRNSALRAIAKATTYSIKDIKAFFCLPQVIHLNGTIARDDYITPSEI